MHESSLPLPEFLNIIVVLHHIEFVRSHNVITQQYLQLSRTKKRFSIRFYRNCIHISSYFKRTRILFR